MQPTSLGLSQSAALAPTASGLLSLGTRYTPSSASAFGTNAVPSGATGTIVTPTGAGLVSATVSGLGADRDPNYRLAAAIAGTGGRGRPRGRRPLRGQFPVVPIDMVRQLGIEQQVILQPAAPVAMRNKAVLCRPLSASRKTQASTVQYEGVEPDTSMTTQTEDLDEFHTSRPQQRKEVKLKDGSTFHGDDAEDEEMPTDTGEAVASRRKTLDAETSTVNHIFCVDNDSQTDESEPAEPPATPQVIPIPIPVPIYVPVPICLYARPVPYLLPFPLPCMVPLPLDLSSEKTCIAPPESETVSEETKKELSASPYSEADVDSDTELPQASEESDSLVIAAEPTASEPETQPRISPEGLLICRIEEEHLWEARQLGDQSPEILLFTMLYFNTKHFGLRLGAAHRQLTLAHFQLTDEESPNTAILCHLPDAVFGGAADGTTTLRVEMNIDFPERCPVGLFKAYLSRCPPNMLASPEAFYLIPTYPPDGSSIWYSTTPMDPTELQVVLNRIKMVKEIQEAFMNGQPEGGF
ncbi:unnamed protein product [Echinostoma caproni]|uniref:DUF3504 domain-containing protein n=1 Tax=Echinostoma caproni TaxID=27848 RepID=A0A183AJ00_9TREM|nr:unnamed protein product [Echinostoma caproni]